MAQPEKTELEESLYHIAAGFNQLDYGQSIWLRVSRRVIDEQISAFVSLVGTKYEQEKEFAWHVIVIGEEPFKEVLEKEVRTIMSGGNFVEVPQSRLRALHERRQENVSEPDLRLHHQIHPEFVTKDMTHP